MNTFKIFNVLLFISSLCINLNTSQPNDNIFNPQNSKKLIKDYTYYFETHRYHFQFDFDNNNNNNNNVISNDMDILFDNININILFHLNTSSYIFNINNNISLNYDYDNDWNEIQTLILTSPSQHDIIIDNKNKNENIGYDDDQQGYFDEYIPYEDNYDIDSYFELDINYDNALYMTSPRSLYEPTLNYGPFIGIKHARQYYDAQRVCQHKYNGQLAFINNENHNNLQLYQLCTKLSHDKQTGETACWINNIGLKQSNHTNNECIEIIGNQIINNNKCNIFNPFICEIQTIPSAIGMTLDSNNTAIIHTNYHHSQRRRLRRRGSRCLFQRIGRSRPRRNHRIKTINFGDYMIFSLEIKVNRFPHQAWGNIIHCGTKDLIRQPGIWINKHNKQFHIVYGTKRNWNRRKDSYGKIRLGKKYKIEYRIRRHSYDVFIDGRKFFHARGRHHNRRNQPCYLSNPWYEAADVDVTNLKIISGNDPRICPKRRKRKRRRRSKKCPHILYQQIDRIRPRRNNRIKSINIGDNMIFSLEIIVNSFPRRTWASIFHCGRKNIVRQPGLWINKHSKKFHIVFGTKKHWNRLKNSKFRITLGKKYKIEWRIKKNRYQVFINGRSFFSVRESHHNRRNEPCYLSDPWYESADVDVTNLKIIRGTDPKGGCPTYKKSKHYSWKGCYKDTRRRSFRYGPHRWRYSVDKCYKACKRSGYKYFALQAGSWCQCENSWRHASKYGKGGGCSSSHKGGTWRNDVFQIRKARSRGRKYGYVAKEADRKTTRFSCRRGYKIRVLSASYGANCKNKNRNNQRSRLSRACNKKRSCSYRIDTRKIGDPARGCKKDYTYQYQCKKSRRKKRKKKRRRRRRKKKKKKKKSWKCSRITYNNYERKICLRKRGRRLQRRRWERKLRRDMRRARLSRARIRSLGVRFRQGYNLGKRQAMAQVRKNGGLGLPSGLSKLQQLQQSSNLKIPRLRLRRVRRGRIPLPPKIKLIDRSSGGRRLRRGQIGEGYNIGMRGKSHHRKYRMPNYELQVAMMQGATKRDLKKAAKLTDIGFRQEERDEHDGGKLNPGGFGGFQGFDGFGSGFWDNLRGKMSGQKGEGGRKKGDRGRPRKKDRRGLLYDIERDVDVYEFGDMENERKCMLYEGEGVYEICVGYGFVEIKKFIKRVDKGLSVVSVEMDDEFMRYIGYEYEKYNAMMNGMSGDGGYGDMYYLDLYEFVYDEMNGGKEECFMNFEIFDVCLGLDERGDMIVRIVNGYDDDKEYSFNFSNDNDWNEVSEVVDNDDERWIEKCVKVFEVKMCMVYENDSKFKMLLYKIV